ncbi:MAG: ribosomal protein L11 methyltransferase [Proteobacteria bacterium SG_bin4]|nr:MAG: ribosomal protein L11 methyltransferase [Proteobacteria bacterium SG_bin4]
MSWITLIIRTDDEHAEALSDALLEQGALSVDIHDAAVDTQDEQMLFGEPGEPSGEIWKNAEVSALFEQSVDIAEVLRNVSAIMPSGEDLEYHLERIEEQDWVRLTQSQFDPIRISQRLWIVPTWHTSPDPAAINLILDPGLAFGTGSHPTTQLCLGWLDQNLNTGDALIDYGCGSGILAIAALKLGASHVTGIDIDPQAIKASLDNALRNQCDLARFRFMTAQQAIGSEALPDHPVDVVIANILTNPLKLLAPILAAATRSGGDIVLSGILQEQAEEVKQIYQQWFDMRIVSVHEGWVLLSGRKK